MKKSDEKLAYYLAYHYSEEFPMDQTIDQFYEKVEKFWEDEHKNNQEENL